jgi:site-specific recombinase XerC
MSGRFWFKSCNHAGDIEAEGDMEVESYLAEKGYSGNTLDKYRRALNCAFAEIKDLKRLSPMAFKNWLSNHAWGSSAQWVSFCAIRGFISWRYGTNHPALKLRIHRADAGPQRALTMNQVQILLASFDSMTIKGIRDLAICSLMLDSGLRSSEICHLELKHLNLIDRHLHVIIKGGRWGEGVFSQDTARYISCWLDQREACAKPGVKALFIGLGGNTRGSPLTRDGLGCIVSTWGIKSGVGILSPHDLRRTFAVLATRLHAPARVLQVAGRWKNLAMVERYTAAITADDFEEFFPVASAMS